MQLMGCVGSSQVHVWVGFGELGLVGLDPGQVQPRLKFTGSGLLGLDLRGTNSGLEGGVRWRLVRLSLLGPRFRTFQSAHRILTFYILTKSSRRVGHDEPIFREIRGLEMIGDFSRGRRGGVGPAVMIFDPPVRSWNFIYGRKALDE